MLPLLLVGVGAVLLGGCAAHSQTQKKTTPPPKDPPEPEYELDFDSEAKVYETYQKAKAIGVTERQMDIGCPSLFFPETGEFKRKIIGSQDRKIQACEVREFILERWEDPKFASLAQEITGKGDPIPWSLDDLDPATDADAKVREKAGKAIEFLDDLLTQQGYDPKSRAFLERRLLGLLYMVAYPPEKIVKKFDEEIAAGEKLQDLSIIDKNILAENKMVQGFWENLSARMKRSGMESFQTYVEQNGGFFTEESALNEEHSALDAIAKSRGACTERSKILYALLKMAGYEPYFVLVDFWKTPYRAIQYFIQEDPLYMHVVIGVKLMGREIIMDPAIGDPDITHQGGRIPVSLLQYLSMDYSNRGIEFLKKDPPQPEKAKHYFEHALQLDDRSFMAYLNLGNFLYQYAFHFPMEKKRDQLLDQALEAINQGLSLNPNNSMGYYQRAEAYARMGKFPEALADVQRAIDLNSKIWNTYLLRGRLQFGQGRQQEAMADWGRAVSLSPVNGAAAVRNFLDNGYRNNPQNKEAQKALDALQLELRTDPVTLLVRYNMASMFLRGGHDKLSQEEMESLISRLERSREYRVYKKEPFSSDSQSFIQQIFQKKDLYPPVWSQFIPRIEELLKPIPAGEEE